MKVKISTTVPTENADELRAALGKAGAGVFGEYRYCSFSVTGKGRFLPMAGANPHIGQVGELEIVEEEQIEVICDRAIAKQVIAALKQAHPYEEVIVEVIPLIDENDV
ncbi:MAG TPA: hypothetical protein VFI74_04975 [Candidatus Saccharimonadales bacterium]|nr:hypothetical protein [Candidatus Saccharimonadales bacterium]